jgi:spermidine/putrescine transport system permease protein
VGPAVLYLVAFFGVPLALVVGYSFARTAPDGARLPGLTLESYRRALDPLYLAVLWRSTWLSLATTAISLVLAYPAAWAIRGLAPRRRALALALVVLPSWMNLLVKNYAWIVLLRRGGVVNAVLLALGLVREPLPLLFNEWAVLVGLVHTYAPFMILPIYAALEKLDWRQVEAARDLGARGWQTFRRVVLPQTRAGARVGCTLVFIPALGAFVTPDLLGGASSLMIGTVIENQVLQVRDWPFASALAVWLMVLVLGALLLYRRSAGAAGQRLP